MRGRQLSRSKSALVDAKVFHLCSVKTLCGSSLKRNYIKPAVALSKDQLLMCTLIYLCFLVVQIYFITPYFCVPSKCNSDTEG